MLTYIEDLLSFYFIIIGDSPISLELLNQKTVPINIVINLHEKVFKNRKYVV